MPFGTETISVVLKDGSRLSLTNTAQDAVDYAVDQTRRQFHHGVFTTAHLLWGVMKRAGEERFLAVSCVLGKPLLVDGFAKLLEGLVDMRELHPDVVGIMPDTSSAAELAFARASELARQRSAKSAVGLGDLATAIFESDEPLLLEMLQRMGADQNSILLKLKEGSLETRPLMKVAAPTQ